ncbi:MAG: LysR family transcriptional regulator [Desulfuromonadales bacterium]|nr:LysR family transcriptional regulator [Desulfuromonadales bacterium]
MELYQLKSFITIASKQNLTRSAQELNISQSALSSQIKALEEELGVSLFVRTSRGMKLTDQGEELLPHARKITSAAKLMQQKAQALHRGASSSVSIGLNTDPTLLKLSAISNRLMLLHQDINIAYQRCQSSDVAQQLLQGKIDLGFCYGDAQHAGIEQSLLTRIRLCVVIPCALSAKDETLSWAQVAAMPWIWVDDNFLFFKILQQSIDEFNTVPNKSVTAGDEQTVRELVLAERGVAIMREDEARSLAQQGRVKIWNQGWGEIPLSLAWLSAQRDERRIRSVREAILHIWSNPQDAIDGSLTDKCWV